METHVALDSRLQIVPSTLITIVKDMKEAKSVMHNAAGSRRRKSLQQSPFQELERLLVAWFKQATSRNAALVAQCWEKRPYTMP
jgi:hypothetical protein